MNKRLTLAFLLFISISAFPFPVSAQSTAVRQKAVMEKVEKAATATGEAKAAAPVTAEKVELDLSEALTVIQENYVSGKQVDYNELFKSSIESMLHTLDPHSNYFDSKEFEEFRTEQGSKYFGIGATIGDLRDADNGGKISTYIKATFDEAPANRAGLRYGDKILDVNGTSMIGKPFAEVRTFLRGPRGTKARITVEHYDTKKQETVDIIRDAVAQPSIPEAYMIRPGVGYLAMTGGFNQTTYAEFVEGLRKLKQEGMQQLILDLRSNGGGLVRQATQVAETFLNRDQLIFTQKGRIRGSYDVQRSENSNPEQVPIVMLVNSGTASASEILAGALQDHDRALIVGETSFGKGLVQNPFVLDYGSMVLLTIAKYETPSGRLIQRDYSNGDLYAYYSKGGTLRDDAKNPSIPSGLESKTDIGRSVYSGGGITPDETVKPVLLTPEQVQIRGKLQDPVFAFSLDLIYGKLAGFENYKVDHGIDFQSDIKTTDFPMTDALYQAFKKYAMDKYKVPAAQIEKEKEYVGRALRTEVATAAYGMYTSFQINNEFDNQLLRGIELLPKARELSGKAAEVWKTKAKPVLTAQDGTKEEE